MTIEWSAHAPWITPELVKAGRVLLGWAERRLALESGLKKRVILDFENGFEVSDVERKRIAYSLTRKGIRFCKGERFIGVQLTITKTR